ncbi:hypothetical protein [Thermogemmatispora sp.]|uniref:hypothetical protein n=1 Tax=Thermogemmatispora sp. TaxID=1968838 RepID=UPI0035E420C5
MTSDRSVWQSPSSEEPRGSAFVARSSSNGPRFLSRVRIRTLSCAELRNHLRVLRDLVVRKQQRELAYLQRRAAKGIRTPTDEVYEGDQDLLLAISDALSFFDETVDLLFMEVPGEE